VTSLHQGLRRLAAAPSTFLLFPIFCRPSCPFARCTLRFRGIEYQLLLSMRCPTGSTRLKMV
jgi:hypothetical protein